MPDSSLILSSQTNFSSGDFRFGLLTSATSFQSSGNQVFESRSQVFVNYSFTRFFSIAAFVPLVYREVSADTLLRARVFGLSDVELRLRWDFLQERHGEFYYDVFAQSGVRMPTGSYVDQVDGQRVPIDAQIGTGAWTPFVSVGFALLGDRLAWISQVRLEASSAGYLDLQRLPSGSFSSVVQWKPVEGFGFNFLAEGKIESGELQAGVFQSDHQRALAALGFGAFTMIGENLLLQVNAKAPFVQSPGLMQEHPSVEVGLFGSVP